MGAPLVPLRDGISYVTYQNVVMEERDGRRVVYLPQYGCAALDAAGRAAYEREGFRVVPVPAADVFRLGGSLRCLVNVLERRE